MIQRCWPTCRAVALALKMPRIPSPYMPRLNPTTQGSHSLYFAFLVAGRVSSHVLHAYSCRLLPSSWVLRRRRSSCRWGRKTTSPSAPQHSSLPAGAGPAASGWVVLWLKAHATDANSWAGAVKGRRASSRMEGKGREVGRRAASRGPRKWWGRIWAALCIGLQLAS